jgi:hypothetical protein
MQVADRSLALMQSYAAPALPLGSPYRYEFLASINDLTVTPVPPPTSAVTLLSGLILLGGLAFRRRAIS